ncbi:MAG: TetR family transcriptional regulator [Deltaproteobacteria bacterium]|nr:TetR family transcriptional regulator [Deltaproteobacteria bacterium]
MSEEVSSAHKVAVREGVAARERRRERRTQQQRSAETRARVVHAATECVAELGPRGATLSAIAARAGVSWGAMQHQFGDKDSILDAVLEESLAQLEERLLDIADRHSDPRERVHAFIERLGELLRGPVHRSLVEIQSERSRNAGPEPDARMLDVGQAMSRIWRGIFGDLEVCEGRLLEAERFTWALLAGITAERMLFHDTDFAEIHLRILDETLLRLLDLED